MEPETDNKLSGKRVPSGVPSPRSGIHKNKRSGGKRATSNIWVTLVLMCTAVVLWVAVYTGDPENTSGVLLVIAIVAAIGLIAYGEIVERNREPNRSNISLLGNVVAFWLIVPALFGGGPFLVIPATFTIMFLAGVLRSYSKNKDLIN